MSVQEQWLILSDRCVDRLKEYRTTLVGDRLEVVSKQIAQIEELSLQVRKKDLFSVSPQSSLLLAASTHEEEQYAEDIISSVDFLFDRHRRAVRLGPQRAEKVLSFEQSA